MAISLFETLVCLLWSYEEFLVLHNIWYFILCYADFSALATQRFKSDVLILAFPLLRLHVRVIMMYGSIFSYLDSLSDVLFPEEVLTFAGSAESVKSVILTPDMDLVFMCYGSDIVLTLL